MLVSPRAMLTHAHKHHWAVGAFNASNLEIVQAIIGAAQVERAPVIVQTSAGGIAHAGSMEMLAGIVHTLAAQISVPVALHLDHGTDLDLVHRAIQSGLYTSIMVDASRFSFQENVHRTKEVVRQAHKRHLFVEAELGPIPGKEDAVHVKEKDAHLTNPSLVRRFIRETQCDALAVSIGTKHGFAKFLARPSLDFPRLKAIVQHSRIPLVLHGASALPSSLRSQALALGLHPTEGHGITDTLIQKAIRNGISKVNVDSDIRLAFTVALASYQRLHPTCMDPREYLGHAREVTQKFIQKKIRLLRANNRVQ